MNTHGDLIDGFEHYLPPSAESTKAAITDALVVVDTNVLLNLYRYGERARSDLLHVLQKIGDRLYVPHQVASEFWERRETVIEDANGMASTYITDLNTQRSGAVEILGRWSNRVAPPEKFVKEARSMLDEAFAKVTEQVNSLDTSIPATAARDVTKDEVLNELLPLLAGKVGAPSEASVHKADDAEALRRIKDQIPPGYEDRKKSGERPFGDYLVWIQACRESVARGGADLLIVTDDQKPDWWHTPKKGERLGPRREIAKELRTMGGGALTLATPSTLLFHARTVFGMDISGESVRTAQTVGVDVEGAEESGGVLEKMPSGQDGKYAEHILQMTRCAESNSDPDDFIDAFMSAFPTITSREVAKRRVGTLTALGLVDIGEELIRLTADGEAFVKDGDVELLKEIFMKRIEHAERIRELAAELSHDDLVAQIYGGQLDGVSTTQGTRAYHYMRALGLLSPGEDDAVSSDGE